MATVKENLNEQLEASAFATNNALEVVRNALRNNENIDAYNVAMSDLKDRVDEYNGVIKKVDYVKFCDSETPVIEAVTQFFHKLIRVKENRDVVTGTISSVNLEQTNARIDLEKFCDFAEISKEWTKETDRLLSLFVLRETNVFAMKPSEIIDKGNFFLSVATKKKNGETPDSNTQMVKQLQLIVDKTIFVDNGEGKNKYKCTVHDLIFCKDALTKLDAKEKCTIATMKPRQFRTVIMSVLAHILGEEYKIKAAGKKKKEVNATV